MNSNNELSEYLLDFMRKLIYPIGKDDETLSISFGKNSSLFLNYRTYNRYENEWFNYTHIQVYFMQFLGTKSVGLINSFHIGNPKLFESRSRDFRYYVITKLFLEISRICEYKVLIYSVADYQESHIRYFTDTKWDKSLGAINSNSKKHINTYVKTVKDLEKVCEELYNKVKDEIQEPNDDSTS